MKKLGLVLLMCVAAATAASAAPNWLGITGLLQTPTADALDSREWNAAYHHVSDVSNIAAVNFGLARGLEVGGVFLDPRDDVRKGIFRDIDDPNDSKFTAHAKYRLIPETARGIGLAVGWWDVLDEIDSAPYGVVSKRLGNIGLYPLRVHAGVGGGVYDGFFAGADVQLAENLLAMAEFDSEDVNAGIRWGLPSGFRIDAGIVSEEFGIGASYNAKF